MLAWNHSHSLSHLPPILDHGTSFTLTQEHSTTAAPYCSRSGVSAGESVCFAFGLQKSALTPHYSNITMHRTTRTHEMTTPGNLFPICNSRISPKCINFFPEHLFGSQCPRSQHAAWNAGRPGLPPSSPSRGRGGRNPPALPWPRRRAMLSFLCRTIIAYYCYYGGRE